MSSRHVAPQKKFFVLEEKASQTVTVDFAISISMQCSAILAAKVAGISRLCGEIYSTAPTRYEEK